MLGSFLSYRLSLLLVDGFDKFAIISHLQSDALGALLAALTKRLGPGLVLHGKVLLLDGLSDESLDLIRIDVAGVLDQSTVSSHHQVVIWLSHLLDVLEHVEHLREVLSAVRLELEGALVGCVKRQDLERVLLVKLW